jgi:hypothetical protein
MRAGSKWTGQLRVYADGIQKLTELRLVRSVPEFAGDEELLASDAGVLHASGDLLLVDVDFGEV